MIIDITHAIVGHPYRTPKGRRVRVVSVNPPVVVVDDPTAPYALGSVPPRPITVPPTYPLTEETPMSTPDTFQNLDADALERLIEHYQQAYGLKCLPWLKEVLEAEPQGLRPSVRRALEAGIALLETQAPPAATDRLLVRLHAGESITTEGLSSDEQQALERLEREGLATSGMCGGVVAYRNPSASWVRQVLDAPARQTVANLPTAQDLVADCWDMAALETLEQTERRARVLAAIAKQKAQVKTNWGRRPTPLGVVEAMASGDHAPHPFQSIGEFVASVNRDASAGVTVGPVVADDATSEDDPQLLANLASWLKQIEDSPDWIAQGLVSICCEVHSLKVALKREEREDVRAAIEARIKVLKTRPYNSPGVIPAAAPMPAEQFRAVVEAAGLDVCAAEDGAAALPDAPDAARPQAPRYAIGPDFHAIVRADGSVEMDGKTYPPMSRMEAGRLVIESVMTTPPTPTSDTARCPSVLASTGERCILDLGHDDAHRGESEPFGGGGRAHNAWSDHHSASPPEQDGWLVVHHDRLMDYDVPVPPVARRADFCPTIGEAETRALADGLREIRPAGGDVPDYHAVQSGYQEPAPAVRLETIHRKRKPDLSTLPEDTIGQRLRAARLRKGLSTGDVYAANWSGSGVLSPGFLEGLEADRILPTRNLFAWFGVLYEVHDAYLLHGVKSPVYPSTVSRAEDIQASDAALLEALETIHRLDRALDNMRRDRDNVAAFMGDAMENAARLDQEVAALRLALSQDQMRVETLMSTVDELAAERDRLQGMLERAPIRGEMLALPDPDAQVHAWLAEIGHPGEDQAIYRLLEHAADKQRDVIALRLKCALKGITI